MSISDDEYKDRFPGEYTRPARDIVIPRAVNLGVTLVGLANISDTLMLADGYDREEHERGIVNMVNNEGDVVPIDTDTLGNFDLQPQVHEAPIIETLTADEEQQLNSIRKDVERLQLVNGGMALLLTERLPLDPSYTGGRTELGHRARLSMIRLISEISLVRNLFVTKYPDNAEVRQLVDEISSIVTPDTITQLQRLFLGGIKGENTRTEVLSHEVAVAARRRGLDRPETTAAVCILGPKGTQLVSLIEDPEPQD